MSDTKLDTEDLRASYEAIAGYQRQTARQQWPILSKWSRISGKVWNSPKHNVYDWHGHYNFSCVQGQKAFQEIWNKEITECDTKAQYLFICRVGILSGLVGAKAFHYIGDVNVPIFGGNLGPFGWGVAIGLFPDEKAPLLGVVSVIHLFNAGYRLQGMIGFGISAGGTFMVAMSLESPIMQTRRAQFEERQKLSDQTFAEVWKAMCTDLNERYKRFSKHEMDEVEVEQLTRDASTIWTQREAIRGTYGALSGATSRRNFDNLCNLCGHIVIRVGAITHRDRHKEIRQGLTQANHKFTHKFPPCITNTSWRNRLMEHYTECLKVARQRAETGGGQEALQHAKKALLALIVGAKKVGREKLKHLTGAPHTILTTVINTTHDADPLGWLNTYEEARKRIAPLGFSDEFYDVKQVNHNDVKHAWCVATYLQDKPWGKTWGIQQKIEDFENGIVGPVEFFEWVNHKIQKEYSPTLINPPAPACPIVVWSIELYKDREGGGAPSH